MYSDRLLNLYWMGSGKPFVPEHEGLLSACVRGINTPSLSLHLHLLVVSNFAAPRIVEISQLTENQRERSNRRPSQKI